MKFIGFFREMHGEERRRGESLLEAARIQGDYDTAGMTSYLASGHPVLDVMEATSDLIGNKFHSPGGASVVTDGKYAWRADLVEYVRHYRINLPQEFVQWVDGNSYEVPEVDQQDLIDISVPVNHFLGFNVDPGAGPRRKREGKNTS
ncbi:hypothetical protein ACG5V6_10195 [Streptomyces chitinivorans]|uniref:Uncharacterized protein n=1 Tax=Streptomyces chitinivorans TaxID=1257027 RepID=A0ABW7HS28_9ACTN|nr:hypothetical protein [Streptomyces chitinivorans]MDH2411458.1 hypothetical protein [Streptomyces chitinivorans]